MRISIMAVSLTGILMLGVSSALAHDDGCNYQDGVTTVERGYDANVVHYDHHHYAYDDYGNPYVVHHDHHYVVPNDDYGYRQQYYDSGYRQHYYRSHRRHRAAFRFFFNG